VSGEAILSAENSETSVVGQGSASNPTALPRRGLRHHLRTRPVWD